MVTTIVLNRKTSEVENKIPHNAKYITNPEFNMLASENAATRLTQASLMNKPDFDNKPISFNRKTTSN